MREAAFDVVVAGAGPAGSTTALRLAREGFSVAVVEARRFPRFKPCGEFMSPECLPMLRDLGVFEAVRGLGAREVRGMRLQGWGHRARGAFVRVGRARAPFDHGWAVRREAFDQALLEAAVRTGGVEVFEGHRAVRLLLEGDGAVAGLVAKGPGGEESSLRARWTVGADGLRSRVAASLGVRRQVPWLRRLALTTRYAGVAWGDDAEVHLFAGGFLACAPVGEGLVGLNVVIDDALYEHEAAPRDLLIERWLDRIPEVGERLRRGRRVEPVRGVGPLAMRTTSQTFAGAALVGDASGYVDPITGEGIFFALKGAELLAESLVDALRAGRTDRPSLAGYRRGRRREIVPRAAFGTLLQRVLRRPNLVRAGLGALEARPALADLLVSIAGDYVPLRELLRPSTWRARPRPDVA